METKNDFGMMEEIIREGKETHDDSESEQAEDDMEGENPSSSPDNNSERSTKEESPNDKRPALLSG